MNTIGNRLVVDTETESALIAPKGGFGGVAGGFAKHMATANVKQLRQRLHDSIDVVGVGGVKSGADAFDLLLCGAAAVQTATTHWLEGPACFDRIADELKALMKAKGYTTLDDFRGKLAVFEGEQAEVLGEVGVRGAAVDVGAQAARARAAAVRALLQRGEAVCDAPHGGRLGARRGRGVRRLSAVPLITTCVLTFPSRARRGRR